MRLPGFARQPSCFLANSRWAPVAWFGGTVRVCGGRREPIPGGLAKTSMFLTPPQTRPVPPSTDDGWPREITSGPRSFSCVSGCGSVPCRRSGTDATRPKPVRCTCHVTASRLIRRTRRVEPRRAWLLLPSANDHPTGGGRRAAPVGTVKNMGPAHAPDGLGRTPNPGLAVYAGLRTRASFCQAPRDGFTACPGAGLPVGLTGT